MIKKLCQKKFDVFGIGTAISGLAGAGSNIAGAVMSNEIAKKNLEFQKEKFEYDKHLQQQVFDREDSAYQRQRDDMLSAGLNPLSNPSSGANAGSVVPTEAPQNNFDALTAMSNLGDSISKIVDGVQASREREATIHKAEQEAQYIKSQTDSQNIKNEYERDLLEADRKQRTSNANEAERLDKLHEKYGTTSESPDILKTATAMLNIIEEKKLTGMVDELKNSDNKYLNEIGNSLSSSGIQPSGFGLSENDFQKINSYKPSVPKPKQSFGKKFWDSWSNPDNFFKQHEKKKNIEKNNRKYYESFVQALRNNSQ